METSYALVIRGGTIADGDGGRLREGDIGLSGRGRLAIGLRADLDIIDYDALRLHAPDVRIDLPDGRRRLVQHTDGYVATSVAGEVTYRNGEATDSLPGRLIQGEQTA